MVLVKDLKFFHRFFYGKFGLEKVFMVFFMKEN